MSTGMGSHPFASRAKPFRLVAFSTKVTSYEGPGKKWREKLCLVDGWTMELTLFSFY
jgi:hypothetical protein